MAEQTDKADGSATEGAYYKRLYQIMYPRMVNEDYQPSADEDQILEILKEGRDTGEPWGHATPRYLREETGIKKGNIEYHLRQLTTAGWISKVTRGFYRYEEDPRE